MFHQISILESFLKDSGAEDWSNEFKLNLNRKLYKYFTMLLFLLYL